MAHKGAMHSAPGVTRRSGDDATETGFREPPVVLHRLRAVGKKDRPEHCELPEDYRPHGRCPDDRIRAMDRRIGRGWAWKKTPRRTPGCPDRNHVHWLDQSSLNPDSIPSGDYPRLPSRIARRRSRKADPPPTDRSSEDRTGQGFPVEAEEPA